MIGAFAYAHVLQHSRTAYLTIQTSDLAATADQSDYWLNELVSVETRAGYNACGGQATSFFADSPEIMWCRNWPAQLQREKPIAIQLER